MKKEKESEKIVKDNEQFKVKLLIKLGFADPSINEVQLTYRAEKYDALINTSGKSPEDSAKILRELRSAAKAPSRSTSTSTSASYPPASASSSASSHEPIPPLSGSSPSSSLPPPPPPAVAV